MPKDNEQEIINDTQEIIETENNEIFDEVLELKKDLAEEIVDKLLQKERDISSLLLKGTISDYLVNENSFSDIIHDELLIGNIGQSAGIITPELKKYREMISKVKTKDDLEKLKTTIFGNTGEDNQDSSNTPEQTDTQTDTTQLSNPATATVTTASTLGSSTDEKAKVDSSESYEIDHLNITVSPETKKIWENLKGKEKPDLEPFACALKAYNLVKKQGKINNPKYLTVVDFTKKKGKKRFFVINMENNTVEHAVKVGHGKNTGDERAKQFSNKSGSKQSSLGGYLLPDTITKSPNKSRSGLRQIKGLESSNNNSAQRGIAVHPGGENGSEGCFTLPKDISKTIMEKIKGGFLFAYAESKEYFAQSNYFQENPNGSIAA